MPVWCQCTSWLTFPEDVTGIVPFTELLIFFFFFFVKTQHSLAQIFFVYNKLVLYSATRVTSTCVWNWDAVSLSLQWQANPGFWSDGWAKGNIRGLSQRIPFFTQQMEVGDCRFPHFYKSIFGPCVKEEAKAPKVQHIFFVLRTKEKATDIVHIATEHMELKHKRISRERWSKHVKPSFGFLSEFSTSAARETRTNPQNCLMCFEQASHQLRGLSCFQNVGHFFLSF